MSSRKKCVTPEAAKVDAQVATLAALIEESRHCVFCTGAGISTNPPAGLRDCTPAKPAMATPNVLTACRVHMPTDRGPDGIWTEAKASGLVSGEPGAKGAPVDCPWDEAMYQRMPQALPTLTHRAITLCAPPDDADLRPARACMGRAQSFRHCPQARVGVHAACQVRDHAE